MSSGLRPVWETLVGLVVEDGQLAIGIVVSLAIVWLLSLASTSLLALSGWILLALLVALLVVNLLLTARRAKRRIS